MKFTKLTSHLALATAAALSLAACGGEATDEAAPVEEAVPTNTVVDVAGANPDFSTLASAITAAGLGETLTGEGPYTIFAPTNDAFAKIDEATLTELTTNDTETLSGILTYHVLAGKLDAATLIAAIESEEGEGYTLTTVNGATLTATLVDGAVVLTDGNGGTAKVEATDVEASNGLIHPIDTVLMPAEAEAEG